VIFGASATHALRALAHLAAHEGEEARLGRDLSREVGVPEHYLAKILATLARAGVLVATRGARGGYRLARPAGEITLLQVLEPIEGKRVRPGCLLRPGEACREEALCAAHPAWGGVKAAYTTFLEETTLEDIRGGATPRPARGPRPGRKPARRTTRSHHRRTPSR
jgi:Rrf2 family protein